MKCCGETAMPIELQVAGQPFELHRCGQCDTGYWVRDGQRVPLEEVTASLQAETDARSAAKAERRAKRERRPSEV